MGCLNGSCAPGWWFPARVPLRVQNYYLACGLLLVVLVLLRNTVLSRVGRALKAIHDGEGGRCNGHQHRRL